MFRKKGIRFFFGKFMLACAALLVLICVPVNIALLMIKNEYEKLTKIIPLSYQLHLMNDYLDDNFYTLNLWLKSSGMNINPARKGGPLSKLESAIFKIKRLNPPGLDIEMLDLVAYKIKMLSWKEKKLIDDYRNSGVLTGFIQLKKEQVFLSDKIKQNIFYLTGEANKKYTFEILDFYKFFSSFNDLVASSMVKFDHTKTARLAQYRNIFNNRYRSLKHVFLRHDISDILFKRYSNLVLSIIKLENISKIYSIDHELIYGLSPLRNDIHRSIKMLIQSNIALTENIVRDLNQLAFFAMFLSFVLFLLFSILASKYIISINKTILTPIEYLIKNIEIIDVKNFHELKSNKKNLTEFRKLFYSFNRMIKKRISHERKLIKQSRSLQYLASHDLLTGLINFETFKQVYLDKQKEVELKGSRLLVCYLSLNNLNAEIIILNTSEIDSAIKLFSCELIKYASKDVVFSRRSDSSFIILLTMEKMDNEKAKIEKLSNHIDRSFKLTKLKSIIDYSLVAIPYPKYSYTINQMISCSQFGVKILRNKVRAKYFLFDDVHDLEYKMTLNLEKNIKDAVKNKEITVVYQPQYSVINDQIIGCEALIRWTHPEFGIVPPNKFISIAERTGFIIELGEFLQKTALNDYIVWKKKSKQHVKLSMNASLIELLSSNYVNKLIANINLNNLETSDIEIELTESIIDLSHESLIVVLNELNNKKFSVAIDDFGTGYSSLERLSSFPFNLLKIDKCFIDNIAANNRDKIILKSIIELAKGLNLDVICEGVESREQFLIVKALGCDYIQGFYYSKPVSSKEFLALLHKQ